MSGIYLHIPFCRKKCAYCDFHFSTDTRYQERMVQAIIAELNQRKDELNDESVHTVYFGGGTPSLLSQSQLASILSHVKDKYDTNPDTEYCIEANPEDLTIDRLSELRNLGFNRLSIGIQTFDSNMLQRMGRIHDGPRAKQAVREAQKLGFDNISVDMIYGIPRVPEHSFLQDLEDFLQLEVQHISCYALTIEEKTQFAHEVKIGKLHLPDESVLTEEFLQIRERLSQAGFEHYEVSNFCRPGYESRHNSSYWKGHSYLGVGPSAHSFDGTSRSWNLANNPRYMKALEQGLSYREREELSATTRYNEYILTRSRTKWGINLAYVKQTFGVDIAQDFPHVLDRYQASYAILDGHLVLQGKGLFLADGFASDLFLIED